MIYDLTLEDGSRRRLGKQEVTKMEPIAVALPRAARKIYTLFTCAILLITYFGSASAADAAEVCNRTPLRLFVAFGYFDDQSGNWEKKGWYSISAGECTNVPQSSINTFYYYAETDSSDLLSSHFDSKNYRWAGSKDDSDDVASCLTSSEFHDDWDKCYSSGRSEIFRRVDTSGNPNYTYSLWSQKVHSKLGFEISSLEQAREVRHLIKGQILYRRSIENDPKGTPYRIGLDLLQDENGVFVQDVIPGLPTYGIMFPGDRILGFNGKPTNSIYELIFEIQDHAYSLSPEERLFEIYFYRYDPETDEWRPAIAHLDAVYFQHLDDRVSSGGSFEAAASAAANGATFGTLPYLYCAGEYLWDKVIEEKPDHQINGDCVETSKRNRSKRYEQYEDVSTTFDFASSFFSPRLVWKLLARNAARRSFRNFAVAVLDEGLQAAVYEYTWSTDGELLPTPEVVKGIVQGMAIGGGAHLALGR